MTEIRRQNNDQRDTTSGDPTIPGIDTSKTKLPPYEHQYDKKWYRNPTTQVVAGLAAAGLLVGSWVAKDTLGSNDNPDAAPAQPAVEGEAVPGQPDTPAPEAPVSDVEADGGESVDAPVDNPEETEDVSPVDNETIPEFVPIESFISPEAAQRLESMTPEALYSMTPEEITDTFTINIRDVDPDGTKTPLEIAEAYAALQTELREKVANMLVGTLSADGTVSTEGINKEDAVNMAITNYAKPAYDGIYGEETMRQFGDNIDPYLTDELGNTYFFTGAYEKGFINEPYEGRDFTYVNGSVEIINPEGNFTDEPADIRFEFYEFSEDYSEVLDPIIGIDHPQNDGRSRYYLNETSGLKTDSEGNIFPVYRTGAGTELIKDLNATP